jgi:hypothetical protein
MLYFSMIKVREGAFIMGCIGTFGRLGFCKMGKYHEMMSHFKHRAQEDWGIILSSSQRIK